MRSHIGWGLVIAGGVLQVAAASASADAVLNAVPYEQTAIGAIVGPVENALHIPSGTGGWFVIASGLIVLFVVPLVAKRLKG